MKAVAGAFALGCCLTLQVASAQDAIHVEKSELICGGHKFEMTTKWHRAPPSTLAWDAQTLIASDGKPVDLQQSLAKTSTGALPAAVTGWQCVSGARTEILVLAYSCASDMQDSCGGRREWFHLVSPAGAVLDAGYTPADSRMDALLDQLGIARKLSAGLSLQDIIK